MVDPRMLRTGPQLRHAYRQALQAHLDAPSEESLLEAYELGRHATALGVSVLELATAHHEVLAAAQAARGAGGEERIRMAGHFLTECLASYEMVRRGYEEAARQVAVERRQAETVRRLSGFLADASLASGAEASTSELLQLVAEASTELVGAFAALVAVRPADDGAWTAASSPPELLDDLAAGLDAHLEAACSLVAGDGIPVRLGGGDLAGHPAVAPFARAAGSCAWLGAPLLALDGRVVGVIELAGRGEDLAGDLGDALVLHVAQMTSATLERREPYSRRGV